MFYNVILFTDLDTTFWHAKSMGAYRLATELRNHGYSVKVIDFFGNWLEEPRSLFTLLDNLINDQTLFVGFSGTFFTQKELKNQVINSWKSYREYGQLTSWPARQEKIDLFIKLMRKRFPKVKLVYGGLHNLTKVSNLMHYLDYIVIGLADKTIIELANHLSKKTSLKFMPSQGRAKIINHDTTAAEFDFAHSMVSYQPEDHVVPGEVLPLETSRGCLFKCSFCSYPLLGRKKGHPDYHKTAETMANEFRINFEKFGVTKYMFVDDTFNETTGKLENLLAARELSKVDIQFSSYLRTDLIARYPEQLKLLKELGIQTAFLGIESLYQPSAQAIGKGTDPERVKETIYKMKDIWTDRVKIYGSFIVGLPEDNPETLSTWVPWVADPECPIDYPFFQRLGLNPKATDELSQNAGKYGYELDDNGFYWKNRHWDSVQANEYAFDLMQSFWDSDRLRIAGWDMIGLQNAGYSIEQLSTLTVNKLDFDLLKKKKFDQWKQYQNTVLAYEIKDSNASKIN